MSEQSQQCSTCGAADIDPVIIQCKDCDGERFYYQLQRWREAAVVARDALRGRRRWWWRLVGRKEAPLPKYVRMALESACALEKEHRTGNDDC